MSVTRIGETQAKEGLSEELRAFLVSIMPMIKSSEGCQSVQLYQRRSVEVHHDRSLGQRGIAPGFRQEHPARKTGRDQSITGRHAPGSYFSLVHRK